jgi:hypothetical protein
MHGVIFLEMEHFIATAVKSSNPVFFVTDSLS